MLSETPPAHTSGLFARAVRHHLVLVVAMLALGAIAGWAYAGTLPTTDTGTTRVLVNPSVGNPFSATSSSVRQDEQTSLETEAQMVRSSEVLDAVVGRSTGLPAARLASRLQVSAPPSTLILEIAYSRHRSAACSAGRVDRLETQTVRTVDDLRAATAAAQQALDGAIGGMGRRGES